jgi:hypothetical protein
MERSATLASSDLSASELGVSATHVLVTPEGNASSMVSELEYGGPGIRTAVVAAAAQPRTRRRPADRSSRRSRRVAGESSIAAAIRSASRHRCVRRCRRGRRPKRCRRPRRRRGNPPVGGAYREQHLGDVHTAADRADPGPAPAAGSPPPTAGERDGARPRAAARLSIVTSVSPPTVGPPWTTGRAASSHGWLPARKDSARVEGIAEVPSTTPRSACCRAKATGHGPANRHPPPAPGSPASNRQAGSGRQHDACSVTRGSPGLVIGTDPRAARSHAAALPVVTPG